MFWHVASVYSTVLILAAGICTVVGFAVWQRRSLVARTTFALLLWAVAEWSLLTAIEAAAIDAPSKILLSKLQYIGIVSSPVLLLIFALRYTGRWRRLSAPRILSLWIVPLVTLLLVLTNERHHLVWPSITVDPNASSHMLVYHHGVVVYLAAVYFYLAVLYALILLGRSLLSRPGAYRRQGLAVLISIVVPWCANIAYLAGVMPLPGIDMTPVAFAITGLIFAFNVFGLQWLDLVPVARGALVEHMPDGILVLDRHGRVVDLNSAALEFADLDWGIIGRPVDEALAGIPALLACCTASGEYQAEVALPAPLDRCLDVRVTQLQDRDNNLSGRLIVWRDVTAYRRALDQVARLKQFNDNILQNMAEGVLVVGRDQLISFANPASALLLGYAPDDLIGKRWEEVTPLEQIEDAMAGCEAALSAEPCESALRRKDGQNIPVLVSGRPVADAVDAEYHSWLVVFTDITRRKAAEQAERQQRLLAEALRDMTATLNSTLDFDQVLDRLMANVGRVIPHDSANIALIHDDGCTEMVRASGYAERGVPDLVSLRFSIEDTPSLRTMLATALPYIVPDTRTDPDWMPVPGCTWIRSYAGVPIRVKDRVVAFLSLDSATPDFFNPGHIDRLSALADQIAVGIQNARLYSEARQRAEDLARSTRLAEEARASAEAANRAKSAFLANMSHELRTPLNAILGFSELMAREPGLSAGQKETLEIINRSGEHLLGLINDVLDMSKIESGRMTLQPQVFDVPRLFAELGAMFGQRARNKGLELALELDPALPRYACADESKLRQVLVNLVGNAVKFTGAGHIALAARMVGDGGVARLRCEVRDTGPGIKPDDLRTLFAPFVQIERARQTTEGTGLGLAISRELARLMGGDISASSVGVPGLGACFVLEIPLPPAQAPEIPVQLALAPRRALTLAPGQAARRLLVVDDSELSRLMLCRLLLGMGFDVRSATDGEEAVNIWQEWQPDLIWMDLRMPVVDGHEATRRIRAAAGRQPVIIALTASVFEDQSALVLSEGFDDFVPKPVRLAQIAGKLEEHLGVQFASEGQAAGEGGGQPAAGPPIPGPALPPPDPTVTGGAPGAGLTAEWTAALRQAADEADWTRARGLVAGISQQHPRLAATLDGLLACYDYDGVLALLPGLPLPADTFCGEPS